MKLVLHYRNLFFWIHETSENKFTLYFGTHHSLYFLCVSKENETYIFTLSQCMTTPNMHQKDLPLKSNIQGSSRVNEIFEVLLIFF